ncbi:MAG: S4 domain-containing protein [Sulfuricella sp.]|nr:S4 domain-containing protein [Sulfuricella sp.]
MTSPVRLAKRLAESASCSRREAELYITGGWVTVDGQVVEEPQFMVSQQKIELHPEANLNPVDPMTMLFHQPPAASMNADPAQQLICAATRAEDDPSGQATPHQTDAVHTVRNQRQRLTGIHPGLARGAQAE